MSGSRVWPMTVGELSRQTGVPVKTLREYTDLGLIYTLGRSPANYRFYAADALWCVRFIGELRGPGLTVAEIRQLATTPSDTTGRPAGSHLAELLHRSRERVRERIAAQQRILARIEAFEAAHRTDLAEQDQCWAGTLRAPRGVDPHPGVRPYGPLIGPIHTTKETGRGHRHPRLRRPLQRRAHERTRLGTGAAAAPAGAAGGR